MVFICVQIPRPRYIEVINPTAPFLFICYLLKKYETKALGAIVDFMTNDHVTAYRKTSLDGRPMRSFRCVYVVFMITCFDFSDNRRAIHLTHICTCAHYLA